MDSHVCYDLIPYTTKLIVFDTQLTVNTHAVMSLVVLVLVAPVLEKSSELYC